MEEKTDFEKEIQHYKKFLWVGKAMQTTLVAAIVYFLYKSGLEMQAHPGTMMEAWRSKPSLMLSPLLAAVLLIMPFFMMNSHNMTKIKIDHLEDLKAKEEGIERPREIPDEKIERTVRNAERTAAALMSLIFVPVVICAFGFLEALVSGRLYSAQEIIAIPVVLTFILAILAFYRNEVRREDRKILSWRESEQDKPEAAKA